MTTEEKKTRVLEFLAKETRLQRWKRKFLFHFTRKDYCPTCNSLTKWQDTCYNLPGPYVDVPFAHEFKCVACGDVTPILFIFDKN